MRRRRANANQRWMLLRLILHRRIFAVTLRWCHIQERRCGCGCGYDNDRRRRVCVSKTTAVVSRGAIGDGTTLDAADDDNATTEATTMVRPVLDPRTCTVDELERERRAWVGIVYGHVAKPKPKPTLRADDDVENTAPRAVEEGQSTLAAPRSAASIAVVNYFKSLYYFWVPPMARVEASRRLIQYDIDVAEARQRCAESHESYVVPMYIKKFGVKKASDDCSCRCVAGHGCAAFTSGCF